MISQNKDEINMGVSIDKFLKHQPFGIHFGMKKVAKEYDFVRFMAANKLFEAP